MDAAQIEKYEQLGMNVHYYRRKKKLTQAKLAEMVDIEIGRAHV